MKTTTFDSLAAVDALLALDAQLEDPLTIRFPALDVFLVMPVDARGTNGGAVGRIWVVARGGNSVLLDKPGR